MEKGRKILKYQQTHAHTHNAEIHLFTMYTKVNSEQKGGRFRMAVAVDCGSCSSSEAKSDEKRASKAKSLSIVGIEFA